MFSLCQQENYDDFSKETRSDFWREVSGCFEKISRRKLVRFKSLQMSSSETLSYYYIQ
jgi:hypothetical protein